jgi:ABC-type transporter Mla MlaB component
VKEDTLHVEKLLLHGAMTLREADAVRSRLLEAMSMHDTVEIDCSAVTGADVSFIQCLIAARRTAAASGKRLSLAAPAQGALLDALVRGGFLFSSPNEPGPVEHTSTDSFWIKDTAP